MGECIFINLISHISKLDVVVSFFWICSHINLFFFCLFFSFLGQVSSGCENKPFASFGPFSGIGWSSLFRYHEWALTLTLARLLTQRCECIFSKLHSSEGMSAGNVHKTIHTGQTWRSRYRHFLVVLLSRGVTRDCPTTCTLRNKALHTLFAF